MSTLKTDNISPNGSTVNVTSGLNVQGGATLAAVKITGNLDVDGNVFGVNATTNIVTVSSPANTTPVLLLGVSANAGTNHRSILRFGHDQNSSSIPVGEIHGVVDNTAGASQRTGHIEFSTANAGVTAERLRIESTGKIVVNNARGDVGASTTLTGQNALGTIHFVQSTTNDNWVGMTTSATASTPTTSQGGILIQGSGGYGTKIHFLTTDSYAAGQKNRMTIDHVGQVGIGTAAPQVPLDVRGGSVRVDASGSFEQSVAFSAGVGTWARGLYFYDSRATNTLNSVGVTGAVGMYGSGSSPSSIFIGHGDTPWTGTNSIHLLTNGNVGIGTNTPTVKLEVSGEIKASGDITAFSDSRLKKDIVTICDALEKVGQLRGIMYTDSKESRKTGLIAQDVLKVMPEAVGGNEKDYYSVAYGNLVGLLVEAIKELKSRVDCIASKLENSTKETR